MSTYSINEAHHARTIARSLTNIRNYVAPLRSASKEFLDATTASGNKTLIDRKHVSVYTYLIGLVCRPVDQGGLLPSTDYVRRLEAVANLACRGDSQRPIVEDTWRSGALRLRAAIRVWTAAAGIGGDRFPEILQDLMNESPMFHDRPDALREIYNEAFLRSEWESRYGPPKTSKPVTGQVPPRMTAQTRFTDTGTLEWTTSGVFGAINIVRNEDGGWVVEVIGLAWAHRAAAIDAAIEEYERELVERQE